jgi:hypothetical protein
LPLVTLAMFSVLPTWPVTDPFWMRNEPLRTADSTAVFCDSQLLPGLALFAAAVITVPSASLKRKSSSKAACEGVAMFRPSTPTAAHWKSRRWSRFISSLSLRSQN